MTNTAKFEITLKKERLAKKLKRDSRRRRNKIIQNILKYTTGYIMVFIIWMVLLAYITGADNLSQALEVYGITF